MKVVIYEVPKDYLLNY